MSNLPEWIEKERPRRPGSLHVSCAESRLKLIDALAIAWEHFEWQAQTIHQAYHQEETGAWEQCQRGVCPSNRYAMRRIEELGK